MGEFETLCHLDVHEMPPQQIKSLREQAHLSQAVFAAVLNTSLSTVEKGEAGDKKPSGPSLKLLNLIKLGHLEKPTARVDCCASSSVTPCLSI